MTAPSPAPRRQHFVIAAIGGIALVTAAWSAGLGSSIAEPGSSQIAQTGPSKDELSMARLREMVGLQAPSKNPDITYRGDDSCQWTNDRECDDPGIGTGACSVGTDRPDCWRIVDGIEDDTCRWANDGECDEPRYGTGACTQGTDRTDCGVLAVIRFQTDTCHAAFNGICNEPGLGGGICEARTDRADCIGRQRPMQINDHFFGWDDRTILDTALAPWSAIGWIEMDADGASCTATLVAANVIVTAAHCIEADGRLDARGVFETGFGLRGGTVSA